MTTSARTEQMRSRRSRLRVLEAAVALFGERGYEGTTFKDIAARADVSVGLACRYFPTKEHLALAIYGQLADALVERVADLPGGTVAQRFAHVMRYKLHLIAPQRRALLALAGKALDPDARAGVLGDAAEPIRSRVSGVFAAVVRGASDVPADPDRVARALYATHLGLVLLWLQRDDLEGVSALADELGRWIPMLATIAPPPIVDRLEALLGDRLPSHAQQDVDGSARRVLARLFRRRRVHADVPLSPSETAMALHLPRVRAFVESGAPVRLVLPAFPAKAPSARKVLGRRADLAEQLALESLSTLLDELAEVHPPGAELVIASDGAVFADLVGVRDADVIAYRADLEAMLRAMGETRIRVFDLADALGDVSAKQARAALMATYGEDLEHLRERAERSENVRRQVDGIHRFLVEDELANDDGRTKSRVRKETRERAYEVVRRSEAWGRLIAAAFPEAIRLSIHPQPDVSAKIGVHLLATDDAWLTPWHGCAVLRGERFELMKRADAEALGARVIEEDGRASYLEVAS